MINEITELELQACGLDKMWWSFGFGNPVYKDVHNTYLVDKDSRTVFFHHRNEVYKR